MAYSSSNLRLVSSSVDAALANIFQYTSADAVATVAAAGYISNARDMGMRVNDQVFVVDTATPKTSGCMVTAINATTGAATLSAGSQIS